MSMNITLNHEMHLYDKPFEKIKSGEKTIELRLNDEKRRKINIGDTITFSNKDKGKITVKVTALHKFPNFEELFDALPLEKCGYNSQSIKSASPNDMLKYYSKEAIKKYGVVGIEIELIQ